MHLQVTHFYIHAAEKHVYKKPGASKTQCHCFLFFIFYFFGGEHRLTKCLQRRNERSKICEKNVTRSVKSLQTNWVYNLNQINKVYTRWRFQLGKINYNNCTVSTTSEGQNSIIPKLHVTKINLPFMARLSETVKSDNSVLAS